MIEEALAWFATQFATNDVFTGVATLSIMGGALYYLRSVPGWIGKFLRLQLTVEMEVNNDDPVFVNVSAWLSRHAGSERCRRFVLHSHHEEDEGPEWILSPGFGWHVIWRQVPLLVHRAQEKDKLKRLETISIHAPGRRRAVLDGIVREAQRSMVGEDLFRLHTRRRGWWAQERRRRRPLDTVILSEGQAERIVADLGWFLSARGWYAARGVPYRRGYLFSGPPGTGKSSLALALAGHFRLPLYALNMGSVASDEDLMDAFGSVRSGILLIEDVDCSALSRRRREEGDDLMLTASALFNCIDGAMATEGRILIMTTNHPETLDPALTRRGRVDRHETFGVLPPERIALLYERFFPGESAGEIRCMTPAEAQELLLTHKDDPEGARRALRGVQ